MVKTATVLAGESVVAGVCLLLPTLWLCCRLQWLFRTNDNFRIQMCLIALFAVLLLAYAALLLVSYSEVRLVAEQIVVGTEQFLILYVVWRLYFLQYWSAAYNIQKFVRHVQALSQSTDYATNKSTPHDSEQPTN